MTKSRCCLCLRNWKGVVEKKPEKAVMDAGYYSKENLEKAEKVKTDCYVTPRKWEEKMQERKREAKYVFRFISYKRTYH